MATYGMNQLKNGMKLLIEGDPCGIIDLDFVKPGKGQAFVRVKLRNYKTGRVLEKTYKSNESLESADVIEKDMQYLYSDGEHWVFMDPASYEQVQADATAMEDAAKWIKEEDMCTLTLWNGNPILVAPPNHVSLTITETDPGVRGDTSSGGTKPATLETGAVVKVPLFIQEGELIKVDTRTAEYISRVKE